MRDILLRSIIPGRGAISFRIPFYALKLMERDDVEKYINDHKNTAILRAASDKAKKTDPGALAVVSYYNDETIVHIVMSSSKAKSDPAELIDIFYTENLPKFGPHITQIVADIPPAGGKRRKRNTYKKRHGRRRKTQYRRR